MRAFRVSLLVALVLGPPTEALAQETVEENVSRALAGAPMAPAGPAGPQVAIEAGQSNDRAEIGIQWANLLGLKLSAPTSKGAQSTEFTNLDGLADGLALSVNWTRPLFDPAASGFGSEAEIARRIKVCADRQLQEDSCRDSSALESALAGKSRREIRAALAEFRRAWLPSQWLWAIYLEGKAGYKNFEFYEAGGEAVEDDRYSGSASAAVVGSYGFGRLLFSATYEDAKKDQKTSVQRCEEIEGSPSLVNCRTLPFGAPKSEQATVLRAEIRHIFGRLAVSPLASYNLDAELLGLELPIYFLSDKAGALTGGVRFGWRDDDDEVRASVFVGKPLGIL